MPMNLKRAPLVTKFHLFLKAMNLPPLIEPDLMRISQIPLKTEIKMMNTNPMKKKNVMEVRNKFEISMLARKATLCIPLKTRVLPERLYWSVV